MTHKKSHYSARVLKARKNSVLTTLFLLMTLSILFINCAFAASASHITWQKYSSAAFDQAKKSHQLVLIFVAADWCPWCQKMKTTYADSDIVELVNQKFVPVMVNVDKEKDLIKKYRIVHLPGTLILDSNSNVIYSNEGYFTAEQLLAILNNALVSKNVKTN